MNPTSEAVQDRPATLYESYLSAGRRKPEAEMLVWTEAGLERLTLAQALEQGAAVAEGLRGLGVGKGDVIATQLPQSLELAVCFVAAARLGAVLLPIVPAFGPTELGFILRESQAKVLVTRDRWRKVDCRERLLAVGPLPDLVAHIVSSASPVEGAVAWNGIASAPPAEPPATSAPGDLSFLIYTSGTTADPKGVQHSNASLLSEIRDIDDVSGEAVHKVTMSPWPSGHIAGTLMILRFLVSGSTVVLMDHWDAKIAADLMQLHGASFGSGTPFHLIGLLDAADVAGHDFAAMKSFQVGAAPVPPSLVARCAERGLATFRSYGSTEHPTSTYGSPDDPLEKRLTTEGRLVPGVEIRIVDDEGRFIPSDKDGEIVTRGPDMFVGYRRADLNAAAFLPGGWYRTGDIGHLDADGYLILTDRKKDIIIRAGENISSREIEDHLHAHPAVAEVAAVAAPHPRMGEVVCVFIAVRPGHTINMAEIHRWFRERGLTRHKTPERLEIIEALPRNTTGKVLKHELRRQLKERGPATEPTP
jgi:acyl-CoA synthetase